MLFLALPVSQKEKRKSQKRVFVLESSQWMFFEIYFRSRFALTTEVHGTISLSERWKHTFWRSLCHAGRTCNVRRLLWLVGLGEGAVACRGTADLSAHDQTPATKNYLAPNVNSARRDQVSKRVTQDCQRGFLETSHTQFHNFQLHFPFGLRFFL